MGLGVPSCVYRVVLTASSTTTSPYCTCLYKGPCLNYVFSCSKIYSLLPNRTVHRGIHTIAYGRTESSLRPSPIFISINSIKWQVNRQPLDEICLWLDASPERVDTRITRHDDPLQAYQAMI